MLTDCRNFNVSVGRVYSGKSCFLPVMTSTECPTDLHMQIPIRKNTI